MISRASRCTRSRSGPSLPREMKGPHDDAGRVGMQPQFMLDEMGHQRCTPTLAIKAWRA